MLLRLSGVEQQVRTQMTGTWAGIRDWNPKLRYGAPDEQTEAKAQNFQRSDKRLAYLYLLTPEGLEQKARLTARFLQRKRAEYDALRAEIDQLSAELEAEGLIDT